MPAIKQILALEDRMTPTLSKIEQQALQQIQTYEQMSKGINGIKQSLIELEKTDPKIINSEMYLKASEGLEKMEGKLQDVALGESQFEDATDSATSALGQQINRILSWTAIIAGTRKLMGLSDVYTQTTARLDMMNDKMQTTAELQDYIYNKAQKAGASYQVMSDSVAKLGTQAGEAFNNSSKEIVEFTDLLNKLFSTQGMDTSAINSTMYNLNQSLSSGKLLGGDYRILKQNAPQMIKYIEQYYNVTRAELDEMVSKGQVTSKALKNAIFSAADDINNKFTSMPMTFEQATNKIKNSAQRLATPLLKIFSQIADTLSKVFDFLSEHEYILYLIIGALGIAIGSWMLYNTYQTIVAAAQMVMNSAFLTTVGIMSIVSVAILAVAAILLYLWNTNDEVAYGILFAWDSLVIGLEAAVAGIKTLFYGLLDIVVSVTGMILTTIQTMAKTALLPINAILTGLQALGANVKPIEITFADQFNASKQKLFDSHAEDINNSWSKVFNDAAERNATREARTQNRQKIGMNTFMDSSGNIITDALGSIDDIIGTDGTGGKALKTTSNDRLLSDEDMQLLLDVATRDYKLNYQQVTPNITLTFGDVRETADVDNILDEVANRLEEIYDSNLEVSPA